MCNNHGPNMDRRQFLTTCMKGAGAIVAATVLSPLEAIAQDPKIKTLVNNGPAEKRIGLLISGECFTAKEEKKFDDYVQTIITKGFKDYTAFKEILPFLNIYSTFVASTGKYQADGSGAFKVKIDKDKNPSECDETKIKDLAEKAKASMWALVINDSSVRGYGRPNKAIGTTQLEVFMHELGHGFGQGDEMIDTSFADYKFGEYGTLNVDRDNKDPRWKAAIGKVKGIETTLIPGTKNCYRGEKDDCLMRADPARAGLQFGPLCTLGIYLFARKQIGLFDEITEETPISIKKGDKAGIEAKLISSASYTPTIQGWYCTGTAEEMDKATETLREDAELSPDKFSDKKKYTKFELTLDSKTKKQASKTKLPVGEHTVVLYFKDPNPAIFLDPEKVTTAKRVYRVTVAEK